MNKGVAIPYIIAVLLGIAVVAIIGYWFFFLGGSLGGEVSSADCQRKLVTFCSVWQLSGYSGTGPSGGWTTYAKGCSEIGIPSGGNVDSPTCNNVLGRTGAVRPGATTTTTTPGRLTTTTTAPAGGPPVPTAPAGRAGGPCKAGNVCDSTDLVCEGGVCVTK